MPFWIQGWVEVTSFPPAEHDDHAWQGVLRILPIVDEADRVSEELFGLSKGAVTEKRPPASIAAGRGIPPQPSSELRDDLERIRAHELKYGAGEYGGEVLGGGSAPQLGLFGDVEEKKKAEKKRGK